MPRLFSCDTVPPISYNSTKKLVGIDNKDLVYLCNKNIKIQWMWSNMNGCSTLTSTEHPTVDTGLVSTSPSYITLTKELLLTHNGDNLQY